MVVIADCAAGERKAHGGAPYSAGGHIIPGLEVERERGGILRQRKVKVRGVRKQRVRVGGIVEEAVPFRFLRRKQTLAAVGGKADLSALRKIPEQVAVIVKVARVPHIDVGGRAVVR